jgi:ADP-ribose pyrophosphatase
MINEQRLLRCDRFDVVRIKHVADNGGEHVRDVVRHPGAVTILPLVDRDHVCLIKNYRLSIDQILIELPAGTLTPGEEPHLAAQRELAEETGYHAGRWQRLHRFYLSPGVLDECMHLFLATQLQAGPPARERGEQIENWVVPWSDALDMVDNGTIQDAKTITALLLYEHRRGTMR